MLLVKIIDLFPSKLKRSTILFLIFSSNGVYEFVLLRDKLENRLTKSCFGELACLKNMIFSNCHDFKVRQGKTPTIWLNRSTSF
jgi:hypothetical protein